MSVFEFINNDGTFFKIEGSKNVTQIIEKDVISLSLNEEFGQMITGNLQLWDQWHTYSRILRPMNQLKISWGIKQRQGLKTVTIQRQNVPVYIQSPGGGGAENGQITYNCAFMALGARGALGKKIFVKMTKTEAIGKVMDSIGVDSVLRDINFVRGKEYLTNNTALRQDESDFKFLVRCASEWQARVMVGWTPDGKMAACFMDKAKIKDSKYMKWVGANSTGFFEYGGAVFGETDIPSVGEKANVISYTWKQNAGNSMGDNVQIIMVGGKPQFIRTFAKGESIVAWRLVPERIQKEYQGKSIKERYAIMQEIVNAQSFEEVQKYFEPYKQSLAPQGAGFSLNLETLGNPYYTSGTYATFGKGFPDRVGATDRTWYIRKCSHTISRAGYKCSHEVQDVYNLLLVR